LSQYKNLFHHYIHQTSKEDASTFWSGCGAIKKDAFFSVNGFDQNKYSNPCIEDIEMGYSLKKMGHRILLYKHLQVKHLKHYSFVNLLKSDLIDRAIPWTILMLSNKQLSSDLNLKPVHKLSAIAVILSIVTVLMAIASKWFLLGIPFLLVLIFSFNFDFYRFFLKKRGFVFSIKVVPLHFLYYLYSSLGFAIGTFKYYFKKDFI
jgi:GT2 family glycosyltransferase